MIEGARIVAEARRHEGTRWKHQGRLPGVALDCIGLLVVVGRGLGVPLEDRDDYGPCPNPRRFVAQLAAQLDRVSGSDPLSLEPDPGAADVARAGDWLAIFFEGGDGKRRRRTPQHIALRTDYGLIHTDGDIGKVTEHTFDARWRSRVHSAWRLRG
jgi:hypothetical protein